MFETKIWMFTYAMQHNMLQNMEAQFDTKIEGK